MPRISLALRHLAKSPGFTGVALLVLALGIGINSSMFSVLDALIFRNAPFSDSERLVQITAQTPNDRLLTFSPDETREIRDHAQSFDALTAVVRTEAIVSGSDRDIDHFERVRASADLFETFGIEPMLGRRFAPEEFSSGRDNVVLISHTFWQQRFGADPAVVGRSLRIDGAAATIIGVMPPQFEWPKLWKHTRMWQPLDLTPDSHESRSYRPLTLIGRLASSASTGSATSQLGPLAVAQRQDHPELYSHLRYQVLPLSEALTHDLAGRVAWLLAGLAGFVLLISCANLANLQLVRGSLRSREFAVRTALGATRGQLIFHQLVESLVVSILGGICGLGLAWGLNRVLEARLHATTAMDMLELQLDARVIGLTFGLSLLTGVLFGIVPAWLSSRVNTNAELKNQSRGATASRDSHRIRHALIVGEISLALVLLSGAVIMQRGFALFLEQDHGWDSDRVLSAALPLPDARYTNDEQRFRVFQQIEDRLTQLPGVEHAAIASSVPIFGYSNTARVLAPGQSLADMAALPRAFHVMVTPNYFATLNIPLVEGRLLPTDRNPGGPSVVVINAALAQQYWPGESAIGKQLGHVKHGEVLWEEVIGVVGDVNAAATLGPPSTRFTVYRPMLRDTWNWAFAVVRSPHPESMIDTVRRAIVEVDPELLPENIATVPQLVDFSQHNLRLAGQLLTGFGLLGFVLAAVGIYGVIANLVTQRTNEFGIRMALGAKPGSIRQIVLNEGMKLATIGIALGFIGSYGLGRVLHNSMPRLVSVDFVAMGGVAIVLFAIALAACYLPARRATRLDPLDALRES